jgi:hypothetical protein
VLYSNGYDDNNYQLQNRIYYLNIPDKRKAIPYLQEAVKDVSKNIMKPVLNKIGTQQSFLQNTFRVINKLTEAIDAYNKYKEVVGT